ncbi:DUF1707 and DUF4190 domain-containing protein [Kitasatospora sp. NPDC051170]|uniref:DUF1707 and DUF4190 domain-containing protein n=1 Tax=Kitasatospora sp. NPDC051170 TaxID=3364056 RepID=UPI0037A9A9B7
MSVQSWGDPGSQQPAGQHGMRAGHADRDRTVDVLKAAFAEGRLSVQEYEHRHEAAAAAQTYGQLAALIADLPSGPVPGPAPAVQNVPSTFLPPPMPMPMPMPMHMPRPTNGLAIASFVFALTGIGAPVAVIAGHIARGQIRERHQDGDWAAVTGLILGYLGLAFWGLIILLGIVAVASSGSHPSPGY